MRFSTSVVAALSLAGFSSAFNLKWANTKYLMVLGDSYTTTGYNIASGIDSPAVTWTSSDGPSWPLYLSQTFNVTNVKMFDLAVAGALTTNTLITPYIPTVVSLDGQAAEFAQYLAPKPPQAQWSSENTLFAIWIGINDIGNSYYWTNITQADFHSTLMDHYFNSVQSLYQHGARSFLFLTVPPIDKAPMYIEMGRNTTAWIASLVQDYNAQLKKRINKFVQTHSGSEALIYDTSKIFNSILNNADKLGYVNVTGWCDAYANTAPQLPSLRPNPGPQAPGCAPVSSYFWLNSLHPTYPVHYQLALDISTTLAGY